MNLAVRRSLRWSQRLSAWVLAAAVGGSAVSAQQPLPFNYSSQGPYTSADTTGREPAPHPSHQPYPGAQGYGQPHAGGFYFEPSRHHPYSRSVTEVLPDNLGGNYETPLDAVLKAMIRRSYVRMEYLNFSVRDPGEKILGAPAITIVDEDGVRLTGDEAILGDNDGDGFPEGFAVGLRTNNIGIAFRELLVEDDTLQTPVIGDTQAEVEQLSLSAVDIFGGRQDGVVAVTPDLSGFDLSHLNGIRGTLVIPFEPVDFEVNVWGLQQFNQTEDFGYILDYADVQRQIRDLQSFIDPDDTGLETLVVGDILIANTVSVDGVLGETAIIYDEGFVADYQTDIWGTEANFVMNSPSPGEGFKLRPSAGFRYLSVNELLSHVGVDGVNDRTIGVYSKTANNVYGPQVGLRSELVHRWFTIGVEPKLMLGLNSHRDLVRAIDRDDDAGTTSSFETRENKTDFAAVFDLNVSANVHLSENFSLFASYNFIWNGLVTRPHSNIRYNTFSTAPELSGIVVDPDLTDLTIHGFTVGGELHWK